MCSKGLDDHTSGEFDDLRVIAEPLQSLRLAVRVITAYFPETVLLSSRKRGRVFDPLTANPDGIKFQLHSARVLVVFEIVEKSEKSGAAELGFPPASAEGFDELIACNCGFHVV
jgi:hypothetical protein